MCAILRGPQMKTPAERIVEFYDTTDRETIFAKAALERLEYPSHRELVDGAFRYCGACGGKLSSGVGNPIFHPELYLL